VRALSLLGERARQRQERLALELRVAGRASQLGGLLQPREALLATGERGAEREGEEDEAPDYTVDAVAVDVQRAPRRGHPAELGREVELGRERRQRLEPRCRALLEPASDLRPHRAQLGVRPARSPVPL